VFQAAAGLAARGPEMVAEACAMRARYPDRVIAIASLFTPALHRALDEGHVLAFSDPSRAVRAVAALAGFAASAPEVRQGETLVPITLPRGSMSEVDALAQLEAAG